MLRRIPNNTIYSRITVTRMRYRGPVESFKMNKFKADMYKDLMVLKEKFDVVHDRLNQYVGEVVDGITDTISVNQDTETGTIEIYSGEEKENIPILNHNITTLLRED